MQRRSMCRRRIGVVLAAAAAVGGQGAPAAAQTATNAGAEFALRADALWVEVRSKEGAGSADGLRATVRQARVGADVSRPIRAGGLALEPFGEAHFRWDGGTGQTGNGLEVAGGVRATGGRVRIDA